MRKRYLWDNRRHVFSPTQNPIDQDVALGLFLLALGLLLLAVESALRQPSRAKPLTVRITTAKSLAFLAPVPAGVIPRYSFPGHNVLRDLEIRFSGQNIASENNFAGVLQIFSDTQTSAQISNLQRLVLSGRDLHHGWSLNLKNLGSLRFSLVFPRLEELVLKNVQIGPQTMTYLRLLAIKLVLRNLCWFQDCINDFEQSSQLHEVEVSGVHVVDFMPEANHPNFPVHGCANDPGIAVSEHAEECHDQVWRVASDYAEAAQLTVQYAPYFQVHQGQPLTSTVVAPAPLAA
jgi:hypothetical protein